MNLVPFWRKPPPHVPGGRVAIRKGLGEITEVEPSSLLAEPGGCSGGVPVGVRLPVFDFSAH